MELFITCLDKLFTNGNDCVENERLVVQYFVGHWSVLVFKGWFEGLCCKLAN